MRKSSMPCGGEHGLCTGKRNGRCIWFCLLRRRTCCILVHWYMSQAGFQVLFFLGFLLLPKIYRICIVYFASHCSGYSASMCDLGWVYTVAVSPLGKGAPVTLFVLVQRMQEKLNQPASSQVWSMRPCMGIRAPAAPEGR